MTGARVPGLPGHLLVDEAAHTADCTVCGMSVECPSGRFGPVSASDMLAAFVVGPKHSASGNSDRATTNPREGRYRVLMVLDTPASHSGSLSPSTSSVITNNP